MVKPIVGGVHKSYVPNVSGIQSQQVNQAKEKSHNNIGKNCAYFIAGMATVASGMYIAKHAKFSPTNFKSRVLPKTNVTESMPNDLRAVLSRNDNYEQFLSVMESPNPDLLHGTGANSNVYRLPFTDKFVMKVLKPNAQSKFRIGSLGSRNFGQPIWENPENNKILVLNKIPGKPHSAENWSSIIWDTKVNSPKNVTVQQAEEYYDSIIGISKMKQSSFDDLAEQVKFLDTVPKSEHDAIRGYKLDCINPNNLMVDMENQKLSIIDFFGKEKPAHQNSYMDMVAVISDFALMREYHDLLPKEKQKTLIQALKTIDKKSFDAAEKVGLSTDKRVFTTFIDETSKYFPVPNVSNFDGSMEYVRSYDKTSRELIRILEE